MQKPLYIVLKGVWFDAFKAGKKKTEYRLNKGRFHIDKMRLAKGRPVILQRGYTKIRLKAVVRYAKLVAAEIDGGEKEVAIYLRDIEPA
jgi:hypothetical protein